MPAPTTRRCRQAISRARGWLTTAFCICVTVLPAGCSTLEKSATETPTGAVANSEQLRLWNQHLTSLSAVSQWDLKGRMAVRTSQRSDTASVIWHRGDASDRLDIYGPFGSGHVKIAADQSGASLIDASQTVNTAASIRELLYAEAGWPVPFDALKYWLIGAPLPATAAQWQLDDKGRLLWLRQSGWYISFTEYKRRGGLDLPRKLKLEALPGTASLTFPDGKVSDQLVVKFVISKISPNPGSNDDNISSASEN